MTLLKKVFKTIICCFLLMPLSLAAQEKTSLPEGFAITAEGIFYKGTPLLFEVPVQEWEKVLGPARQTGEYNHAKSYTWDNLGVTVCTIRYDDSQEQSPVKVREFYIYFRNLDWTYARTGDWTRYIYTDGYYNIRPQDWNEGKPLTKQQLQDIKYLNTRPGKKKKSDFDIPYQIHNETVSLQGAAIDSTTTMAEINRRLQEKGAKPFHFSAALGGAGSSANGDETGGYSGHYYTGLGNNKKWYQLDSVNWRGEVVYIQVRQLSPDEMDIMNGKY